MERNRAEGWQHAKLSGHKKYDTFKKYVRMSLDEYADDIAKSAENCFF